MDEKHILALRDLVQHSEVRSASAEGGYLQIEFDTCHLAVGSAWRLKCSNSIVGNESAADLTQSKLELLLGKRVTDVDVTGDLNDLRVGFAGGLELETFADSSEYENWTLSGGADNTFVSGPGRLWSAFVDF